MGKFMERVTPLNATTQGAMAFIGGNGIMVIDKSLKCWRSFSGEHLGGYTLVVNQRLKHEWLAKRISD